MPIRRASGLRWTSSLALGSMGRESAIMPPGVAGLCHTSCLVGGRPVGIAHATRSDPVADVHLACDRLCCRDGMEAAMSASTIGAQMPAEITLDDVAAMAEAGEHHRYELSREGVLSITPPATPEHALTVSRLVHWFYTHGFGPDQVTADCGIDVGGGRQPDVTIWAKGKPPKRARSSYAGLDGLLLAIEVVSKDS